ncbi:MAG: DUF4124 domain-containing protein [Desulfobacterales bacterium]
MKVLKILLFIAAGCLFAGSLHADIYEWTDENGVKHFTNYAPPGDATILIKSEEVPYDEVADRARIEAERQQQLELARLEIAEREAELERRAAEAERRALEAERYAEETVRAADQYLEDTRNDRWYYRGGGFGGGYLPPYSRRRFYRNETASIYWIDRPYVDHHKRKYPGKSHDGHSGKNFGNKYQSNKHIYPQKYPSPQSFRSFRDSRQGGLSVNPRSRGPMGGSHSRSGSRGLRR